MFDLKNSTNNLGLFKLTNRMAKTSGIRVTLDMSNHKTIGMIGKSWGVKQKSLFLSTPKMKFLLIMLKMQIVLPFIMTTHLNQTMGMFGLIGTN